MTCIVLEEQFNNVVSSQSIRNEPENLQECENPQGFEPESPLGSEPKSLLEPEPH
ncbi:15515_t:CDS:2 [Gigaspora rosea]|nr:15515_t:CDS:2 [Gigaspora rosea]